MNVLPVITRELRAQARQPFTFMLRLYGVAALLAVACFLTLQPEFTAESGPELFLWLHRALLAAIWILIPLGAADCLSRERREGTLGLLFLTRLSARDIVIAKWVAHGLRAFTLWVASLPVQVLPFLVGGLNWEMVIISCAVNFCSILLVVSVSVLASAYCHRSQRAVALTALLGTALLGASSYFLSALMTLVLGLSLRVTRARSPSGDPLPDSLWRVLVYVLQSPRRLMAGFLETVFGQEGGPGQDFLRQPTPIRNACVISILVGVLLVILLSVGLMLLAARILRRRWRESSRSPRVEKLEKTFCRPVVGIGLLRSWLRRRLERNPVGWLEQRTWSGRLVVWTWLAVMVCVYSLVLTTGLRYFMHEFDGIQLTLSVLLLLSITATAAGSFRRERETRVLELLLVSPLSERQIIAGRLRGIWMQFLPSVGLLVFVWFFTAGFLSDTNPSNALWVLSSFVALPIIGLRNSLSFSGYVGAFIATLVFGHVVPVLAVNLPQLWRALELLTGLRSIPNWPEFQPVGLVLGIAIQLIIAIALLVSLHGNLVGRRFAMNRGTV